MKYSIKDDIYISLKDSGSKRIFVNFNEKAE